jgi:MurNAc alpha-1-phosphate uridylyltransferase
MNIPVLNLPVAILAGGRATRLGAISQAVPKSLVDVAGKPFAVHQIELLRSNGLGDFVFCVGHLAHAIEDRLGDGREWGVRIRYVHDGPVPLGTGGALAHALDLLGETFFVLYGDSYLDCDYQAVARAFQASGRSGLMTVFRNEDRWDRSNVVFEGGRILRYDKTAVTPEMRHIDYGLGAFRRSAFEGRGADEACDLAAVYQRLIAHGDLAGFEVRNRFYEIGSPAGLRETAEYLAAKANGMR